MLVPVGNEASGTVTLAHWYAAQQTYVSSGTALWVPHHTGTRTGRGKAREPEGGGQEPPPGADRPPWHAQGGAAGRPDHVVVLYRSYSAREEVIRGRPQGPK